MIEDIRKTLKDISKVQDFTDDDLIALYSKSKEVYRSTLNDTGELAAMYNKLYNDNLGMIYSCEVEELYRLAIFEMANRFINRHEK